MSESGDNNIPTNEDIINDLTKDLESHCIKTAEDQCIDETRSENDGNEILENGSEDDHIEDTSVDDFVDEDALKEEELKLTDEEKERRKSEASQLKCKGNEAFKSACYLESLQIYTKALRLCPLSYVSDRSILYANRAASKGKLDRKLSAIDDCTKAIELNETYVRAYLRRANFYEELEKYHESLEDFKKVLDLDPGVHEARAATVRLPPLVEEQNEKMKVEMLGKLKDLGNMFLRPFGLSTDNFKLQQDPNTGGYSVNFQQNQK